MNGKIAAADGRTPPAPPRRATTRHAIALSLVAGWAMAAAAWVRPADEAMLNPFIVVLPMIAAAASPFARSRLTQAGMACFDEFERDALLRATTRAYLTLAGGVMLGLGAVMLATLFGMRALTARDLAVAMLAVTGTAVALPILFAEAMVPLPPRADVPEEEA